MIDALATLLALAGALSLLFVVLCAASDWAIPRLITLRRPARQVAWMSEDRP